MIISFKKNVRFLATLMMAAIMLFQLSGCNNDDETDPGPDEDGPNVQLTDGIIVDEEGITLYFFTRDVNGESACEGGCLFNWPVFYVETINAATGLNEADFGTITRGDGTKQTTYKGWPLYYYSSDDAAGEKNGEAVGNVWFVAKPDYSIMLANAQLVGNDGENYKSDYTVGEEETQYFVDAEGRTLYIFINDTENQNNFTAEDLSNNGIWPVFHVDISSLPSTVDASDFGVIDVFGESQLTYKGWPLYYFGQDENRGENKGVSVPSPGVWPIVNTSTEAAPEAPAEPTIMIAENETLGNILTDAEGMTLYYFTRDVSGESECTGGCLDAWPIFYTEEIVLPEGSSLNADDFGTVGEGDNLQITYKGWPLYYFANDNAAGDTNGEGVNNVWYVANPDYDLMIADAQLVGQDDVNYLSDYTPGDGMTKYFTDAEGRTIYIFVLDSKDQNNYTEEDFSNNSVWPIFYVEIDKLPSGMNPDDFGQINVFGEPQLTFKGWPLYYYGGDEERGDNKGVSVPSPGVWPIINNDIEAAE